MSEQSGAEKGAGAAVRAAEAMCRVTVGSRPVYYGTGVQRRLYDECETAGWDPEKRNSFAEECAHLHEEVSEAFREWRLHKDFEIRYEPGGKPTGIPIELADVLIGLFYNAELHGFDLWQAVEIKHRYNLTRSYADEGRRLHDPCPAPTPASAVGADGEGSPAHSLTGCWCGDHHAPGDFL